MLHILTKCPLLFLYDLGHLFEEICSCKPSWNLQEGGPPGARLATLGLVVFFVCFFKSLHSFWRYFVLFRESCVRRTCVVFVLTFMMWPCTLMPSTVVVARSFSQHAGCFTPVSSQLNPGFLSLCTWLRFRFENSQLWNSSWCSFGICYCTLTLSSIYSAQSRLLVVASMVYWIGSVGLYLRNPKLWEHRCLRSKPTCLSMNHLVSESKDHLLSSFSLFQVAWPELLSLHRFHIWPGFPTVCVWPLADPAWRPHGSQFQACPDCGWHTKVQGAQRRHSL